MPTNALEPKTGKTAQAKTPQPGARLLGGFLSLALGASMFAMPAAPAFAEDIDTDPVADEFQQQIESSAAAYNEAQQRIEELERQISEAEEQAAQLERDIPQQQEKANAALVELYKAQEETASILNIILSSDSFSDFITRIDYFNTIMRANLGAIEELQSMQTELAETKASLESDRDEALQQAEAAQTALQEAQAARVETQRRAAEEAAAQSASSKESSSSAESSGDTESDTGNDSTNSGSSEPSAADTDTADWTSEEDAFVSSWTSRINNYLAGSPLAGQGETFARAAWAYGVDPRWSPAIAYVESSLGAYCFKSHNAWGWGSVSWGSWEDAIYSHVAGLARGYGYTLTYAAAQKYCPPNADHWYSSCLAQMNRI